MNNRTFILLLKKSKGELSEAEQEELSALLQYEQKSVMDDFEKLVTARLCFDDPGVEESLNRVIGEIKEGKDKVSVSSIKRMYLKYVAVAAAVIIVFGLAWLFYNSRDVNYSSQTIVLAEKKNHVEDYILPDGTKVKVNKASRLTLSADFNANTREVYLDGEAFFDVVKNKKKPFIVHTSAIDVKVLGTAFNVRAFQEDSVIETSLIRGAVEVKVNKNEQVFQLKPSEKIVIKTNKASVRSNNSTGSGPEIKLSSFHAFGKDSVLLETQWTKEKLAFEDEKLRDLIPRLEKWYNITIDVTDPTLRNWRFSGIVKDESVKEVLELFKITSGLKYKIEKEHVTIYK